MPINLSPDPALWEFPEPVDLNTAPRWAYEDYPEAPKDMASYVYSCIFYNMLERGGQDGQPFDLNNAVVKTRVISEALLNSIIHSDDLGSITQRAKFELLYAAQKTGAWALGMYEFATMSEWMQEKLPNLEGSEYWDVKFLLEKLFPLLESLDDTYHPENLLLLKDEWAKTRASLPWMRKVYDEYMATEAEFEAKIEKNEKKIKHLSKREEGLDLEQDAQKITEIETEKKQLVQEINKLKVDKEPAMEQAKQVVARDIQKAFNVIADPNVQAYRVVPGGQNVAMALRGIHPTIRKVSIGHAAIKENKAIFVIAVPYGPMRGVENALKYIASIRTTDYKLLERDLKNAIEEDIEQEEMKE